MSRYITGTKFQHITVRGQHVPRTSFGDGFDTGDVLVRNDPDPKGQPQFLAVISRRGDDIDVAEVGTIVSVKDLDLGDAVAQPALGVTVRKTFGGHVGSGWASVAMGDSVIACPWDGRAIPVGNINDPDYEW